MLRLLLLVLLSPLVYADTVHVVNKPQVRVTTALVNFHARIMDQWGDGGGKPWTITNDSHHPFAHRQFGGATRQDIRGTNMFGSGYPYGASNTASIANRSFPFGVWPLYWGDNFMGSGEVGPQLDAIRPGGHISIVPLRGTKEDSTFSPDEVYYAVGDSQSLLSILASYVTWCHASLAWPTRFDPTSPNATVKLENVLVYYRASSFALASPSYNNPNSRNASYQPSEEWIPEQIRHSLFWQCLDSTTTSALAILNRPPKPRHTLVAGVLSSLWWIFLPVAGCLLVMIGWCCFEIRESMWDSIERWDEAGRMRKEQRKRQEAWRGEQQAQEEARRKELREQDLQYERYP